MSNECRAEVIATPPQQQGIALFAAHAALQHLHVLSTERAMATAQFKGWSVLCLALPMCRCARTWWRPPSNTASTSGSKYCQPLTNSFCNPIWTPQVRKDAVASSKDYRLNFRLKKACLEDVKAHCPALLATCTTEKGCRCVADWGGMGEAQAGAQPPAWVTGILILCSELLFPSGTTPAMTHTLLPPSPAPCLCPCPQRPGAAVPARQAGRAAGGGVQEGGALFCQNGGAPENCYPFFKLAVFLICLVANSRANPLGSTRTLVAQFSAILRLFLFTKR